VECRRCIPSTACLDRCERGRRRRWQALRVPTLKSWTPASKVIADQSPRDGEVHVMPLQGKRLPARADGTNITASVGPEGVALENTGSAAMSDRCSAASSKLATTVVARRGRTSVSGATCPGVGLVESVHLHRDQFPGSRATARYIVNTSAAQRPSAETPSWRRRIRIPSGRRRRRGRLGGRARR
jgi:hypothetical protein